MANIVLTFTLLATRRNESDRSPPQIFRIGSNDEVAAASTQIDILVFVCQPPSRSNMAIVAAPLEAGMLQQRFQECGVAHHVQLGGDLETLREPLNDRKPHILHFIGHAHNTLVFFR